MPNLFSDQHSDTELLAIILQGGKLTIPSFLCAQKILQQESNLYKLFTSDNLAALPIAPRQRNLLRAIMQLFQRYLTWHLHNSRPLIERQMIYDYLVVKLRHKRCETFAVLFISAKNEVFAYEELFIGGIHEITIYPKEIARLAISYNAPFVIIAHNHPLNDASPSKNDREFTIQLTNFLKMLDITLLEHVIIGEQNYSILTP